MGTVTSFKNENLLRRPSEELVLEDSKVFYQGSLLLGARDTTVVGTAEILEQVKPDNQTRLR